MSKSNDTKPTPAPPAAKGPDAIESLVKQLEGLTPADRDTLQRAGVAIPEGDLGALFTDNHKFGLRCTTCNNLALTFIGQKFKYNGTDYDEPPPVRHDMVPWFQDLEPSQIDRHAPKCQKCFHPVSLLRSGAFDVGRGRLVLLADFRGSRDQRFDRRKAKLLLREITTAISGEDQGSSSYSAKSEKTSTLIDQKHGAGTSAQIDATMEKTGVTKALANGFQERS
jgi:hypothetical protein